ncbi:MAG: hypothetical protein HDQ87_01570 [Clostridia bacterium]|nr:hypothetical protein [Clostridia bacterium]
MKKSLTAVLVAVLCAALSLGLCACSAEEPGEAGSSGTVTEASVEGEWVVVGLEDGDETLTGDTLTWIGQDTTFGFESGGDCFADTNGNVVNGTWKLSGDKITMTFDGQDLTGTVTPDTITIEGGLTLQPREQT